MDNSDGLEPETAEQWLDRVGVVLCPRHLHGPVGTVGAEREFKRAFELNPSHAEGHHQYSHLLLMLGRVNDSFVESKSIWNSIQFPNHRSLTSLITTSTRASTTMRYGNTKKNASCSPTHALSGISDSDSLLSEGNA